MKVEQVVLRNNNSAIFTNGCVISGEVERVAHNLQDEDCSDFFFVFDVSYAKSEEKEKAKYQRRAEKFAGRLGLTLSPMEKQVIAGHEMTSKWIIKARR